MGRPKGGTKGDTPVRSILMAGVGGQGILRASDILCEVMMRSGLDVKKSEVHGMAQRGGCVTSHVRYGASVHSPIAKKGEVGILLAFEKMEALRYLDYLCVEGIAIVNDTEIYPPAVNLGDARYPEMFSALPLPPTSVKMGPGAGDGRPCRKSGPKIVSLGVLSAISLDAPFGTSPQGLLFPAKSSMRTLGPSDLGRTA